MAAALGLYPTGHLFAGTMVIAFFAFSDVLDGDMARQPGRCGPWGAFLDSTLDRFADAAIFAGLSGAPPARRPLGAGMLALACARVGAIVPYARARAEGLGMTAALASPSARTGWSRVSPTALVGLGCRCVLDAGARAAGRGGRGAVVQRMVTVPRPGRGACGRCRRRWEHE